MGLSVLKSGKSWGTVRQVSHLFLTWRFLPEIEAQLHRLQSYTIRKACPPWASQLPDLETGIVTSIPKGGCQDEMR